MLTNLRIALVAVLLLAAAPVLPEMTAQPAPELRDHRCPTLLALYGALGDAAERKPIREAPGTASVERSGCAHTRASLLDAAPVSGVNPFDEHEPAGFGAQNQEQGR